LVATGKHRGPIHHLQIDIEAGLLQLLGKNLRRNARRLEVAGLHHNDRLAGIFRRLERRARRLDGRIRRSFGSGLAVIGGAAGEECCARCGVFGIEAEPVQHLALIDQLPQHAPDRRIVERLLRGVEAIGAGKHVASGEVDDLHLGVLFENRQQIERRVLHVIHFAGLQRDAAVEPSG
jgi:hypothetical protein